MEQIAAGLYSRSIATLRHQFPFMEKGSKRPDQPAIAHAAVRFAVAEARKRCRGRMTSQAQAIAPLDGVQGLAFLGFPLHPSGKPSIVRAEHLSAIRIPMLFIQGTRDKLADTALLASVTKSLGRRAAVHLIDHADPAFHVPAKSGRTDSDVVSEIAEAFASWITRFSP
jgi:predicted alpha/beta-hydrolase family hydrolase